MSDERTTSNATPQQVRQALDDWLDGKCVDEQMKSYWLADEKMAEIYLAASQLKQKAAQVEPIAVPHWDAETTFVGQGKQSNWLTSFLAGFDPSPRWSMAFSIVAMLMVLFNVELHFDDGKMTVAFAGNSQQQLKAQLEQQFEQRLAQYDREQQLLIATYFDDIQAKQQQDVTELASYLINASRQERKEDIGALVSYFNQQRSEDLSLNQQQLSQLVYQLQAQPKARGNSVRHANVESFGQAVDANSTIHNQEEH